MFDSSFSMHCPFCGKDTAVSPAPLEVVMDQRRLALDHFLHAVGGAQGEGNAIAFYESSLGPYWIGKCNFCQYAVLVLGNGQHVWPTPQPSPTSADVPEPMRRDLHEAKRCLAAGAFNACVVMARRSLQCAAIEKGATKGKQLWEHVQELLKSGTITKDMYEWAEAARWIGNHGAHDTEPDIRNGVIGVTDVTKEDADDMMQLVESFFEALYVAPARAKEQLQKRNKQPHKVR